MNSQANQERCTPVLTFDLVMAAYRKLLEGNPGKAIVINGGCVAMLVKGDLFCSPLDQGAIDISDTWDFDPSFFVNGGWDGDEEETALYINSPVFMKMPEVDA